MNTAIMDTNEALSGLAQLPGQIPPIGREAIGESLRHLLSDVFSLYLKTKNFHWHISGPHFRSYHKMLDKQGEQLFAMTDAIAERGRKLGMQSLHSIGEIARLQTIRDNDEADILAPSMLHELCIDNSTLAKLMRDAHDLCDTHGDVATASLLENWIDETEGRVWFLIETLRAS